MFQSLRAGTPFYVLHKNEPKIEVGEVLNVSPPMPQYDTTYRSGMLVPPRSVVDISIKIGDQTVRLEKIQADREVDDYNGMVVSANRTAILHEVQNVRKAHLRELDLMAQREKAVAECDSIINMLDPQMKQEAERDAEIKTLRQEMVELKELLAETLKQSSQKETK